MKFETVQIHFLSDVFRFVAIQKFCYHGNVTSKTSPLYYHEDKKIMNLPPFRTEVYQIPNIVSI